ncbi:hypothetical protein ID866_7249 [Astraeus odoratus]|nr:hypothetical protein ID866_7249 [Astraeus odoratus]
MVEIVILDLHVYLDQVQAIFPDEDQVVNLIVLGGESFAQVVVVLPERPAE